MTLQEIIKSENCLLVLNQINKNLPTSLQNIFKLAEDHHDHHTRTVNKRHITYPQVNTTNYGLHSITFKAAKDWNTIQKIINFNFSDNYLSKSKFLKAFTNNIFLDA